MIQEHTIYRQMFEALKTGELSELIRMAYETVRHPLIFTNASYVKLIEVYPDTPQGDRKWDDYIGKTEVNVETIVNLFEQDYIDVMKRTGSAVVMDTGYFADSPRLTAPVFSGDVLIGYVSMLCQGEKPGADLARALETIADALGLHMREFYGEHFDQINLRSIFAEKLISGELRAGADLKKWTSLTNVDLQPRYIMLTFSASGAGHRVLVRHLYARIQLLHLPILMYQTEETVCALLYGLTGLSVRNVHLRQLGELLFEYGFACGVSRSFSSIEEIQQYRRQSEVALQIGSQYQPDVHMHMYRDLTLTAITDAIILSLGYDNAIHPAISMLQWADENRNTDYLETLKTYVLSGSSSQDTCEKLHIHRNTLNYRLSRIEEMAGLDLKKSDTRTHLAISFLMMDRVGKESGKEEKRENGSQERRIHPDFPSSG